MFGSNKNLSLGVGDEDDRQYPDRIQLQRPNQLVHKFYEQYVHREDEDIEEAFGESTDLESIPTLVRNRTLVIQDVIMSKFHSAILTGDSISNLYICGVGRGGRLGLGDENTQFKFRPVQGPLIDKKIWQVALGQNHSMALAGNGELWTWGLNSDSQLGYVLPPPQRTDEEPMTLVPRQVFGSLKKELVLGIAASAIHSVAHTGSSLYCWGRNVGQLALMDADSRSLDVQQVPRKVAAFLLSAPIEMVSAIDKATTCLLSNHSVWVFTNYGYNLIKFPVADVFTNHNLATSSFGNRHDSGRRQIKYVTSGGETIAAVSARGDLFTMHLSSKGDASLSGVSTTNPVKIKGAVTQPQCIWDSRKDGVDSVSVGEHGSVIICTKTGAVWRRVKRLKGKIFTSADSSEIRQKDFKFQRVPYITDCVAVRSSTFGAFATIRKDSKVMSQEISIDPQTLWDDIGSLLCLSDFTTSQSGNGVDESRKAWLSAINREKPGSLSHALLSSTDIETDILNWLRNGSYLDHGTNLEICTSSAPGIKLPVHDWLLSSRSPVLRGALAEARISGLSSDSEVFSCEKRGSKTILTLLHVDIYTLLNIVVYIYQDAIVPVWKYTREAPISAHRFRQVRSELMKIATKLQMPKLEAAARLQSGLERSLDINLQEAILDPIFFDDGDIILELDGDEMTVHSDLICLRCPFFEGMFHGRSQGQWLATRRNEIHPASRTRVDLRHIQPTTFSYVVSYLYGDVGEEMFNDVTMETLDEFSELVLDVMSVANELMLDRLSQICQCLIGKFVTTRNIANLLNEISPCSVTEFKDTGLEYICLQLETMLENHLLDGLDQELLHELDRVVGDNQLACLPFARSGRADMLIHEKYPDLALDISEERQRRVREKLFKHQLREEERRLASASKPRFGSLDDANRESQTPDRFRRRSKAGQNESSFSPSLRASEPQLDMMFDMEDEKQSRVCGSNSPQILAPDTRPSHRSEPIPRLPEAWRDSKQKNTTVQPPNMLQPIENRHSSIPSRVQAPNFGDSGAPGRPVMRPDGPWASPSLLTSKLDLGNILSPEAPPKSALAAGIAAQASKEAITRPQGKISQKERKRQLQMQAEAQAAYIEERANAQTWEQVSPKNKQAPWKAATPIPKISLRDAMSSEATLSQVTPISPKPLTATESKTQPPRPKTTSPAISGAGQGRTGSVPTVPTVPSSIAQSKPLIPHSKSYMTPTPKLEQSVGASMSDIIGQQRREQELIKEAVAKRSLQEIQQEQAFQEWWDQESRRAQEEESRRLARSNRKDESQGRNSRRGRGGKAKASEASAQSSSPNGGAKGTAVTSDNASSRRKTARGKGKSPG